MSKRYDTAMMRRAAGNLNDISDDLKNSVGRVYREIGRTADDRLSGEYAKAIIEEMDESNELCRKCRADIDEISRLLRLYAAQLDLADEKVSEIIRQH